MGNFIDCWNSLKSKGYKHPDGSPVLGDNERASIESRIKEHIGVGVDPTEAARLAVQSHLEESHGQLQSVYDQLRERYPYLSGQEAPPQTPAATEPTTAQPLPKTEPAPPVEKPPVQAEGTGISKAAIGEQRAERELPAIERQKQIDFGTSLDRANQIVSQDPLAPQRLMSELQRNPKAVNPEDTPLLIRRVQELQSDFDSATKAVNEAKTPEDLTAAKSRLSAARAEYDDAIKTTQDATSKTGAGLNSLKMIVAEDYSLAKMESRLRAAKNGQSLNPVEEKNVARLQKQISELETQLRERETRRSGEATFRQVLNEVKSEASQPRFGRDVLKFFSDAEARARQRIIERRGRLNIGADPGALVDEAIIGASHIAKGLVKFADWSAQMISEFGERVQPYLQDLWVRSKALHNAAAKAARSPEEVKLERSKTAMAKRTIGLEAQIERGDFTKQQRQKPQWDVAAFRMKANLDKLRNQFEKGVAKEAYKNRTPAQKFWDHFVGVERAMKLSGPAVFGKLGVAAAVREGLAPIEGLGGYAVSKVLPGLTKGTRYGVDFKTLARSEIKAKASLFTEGMKDAWQNVQGKETELDAIQGKYKNQPDFWYNRVGQMHAAIKAPIKRAEFTRSLEQRMSNAIQAGEDIAHPEVMTRLANESVIEANRAIFQENTAVSGLFSALDRLNPAGGRVARFLFPVVKIPVNLFKELVNLHVGAPVAAAKIGRAYWRGIETAPALEREAMVRQLVKGSVGGAALLWGYYNSDKVRGFFDSMPHWFQHTPIAMILNEGSYLKKVSQGGAEGKEGAKELAYMAKTDIPFMYTVSDIVDAVNARKSGALLQWINNMTRSTVVPQLLEQTAKRLDTPGTFPSNLAERPTYRVPANPIEAVKTGIPGLRQTVPEKSQKGSGKLKPQQLN